LTREEALGRLQQEHTALEGAQAALKQREDEVSRLYGELVQISISHEDLRQSLEEQEAIVRDLQRQAEEARKSLEGEKKQVEGELTFVRFLLVNLSFGDSLPTLFFFVRGFQTCGPPWGTRPPRLRPCRRPTTPLNRSWRNCGRPHLRPTKRSRRARHRTGARWRASCAPSGGMSPNACAVPSVLAS
jgi:hypothetical protein